MGHSQFQLPFRPLMILILLLAVFLGMQRLDGEGLWYDEIWSVMVAGGANYGPASPQKILANVVFVDPTQGMGYPLLLGGWGAVAGWTEFSIRVLSLFGALLAIALAYRLGSEAESRLTGLLAALILSVSSFFVWYMHEGRTYTLVVMLALLLIWAYRRLMLTRHAPSWKTGMLFVLGGAGLLYANYFTVSLLAALAVYHLLFAPKNRRWWYVTYLAVMSVTAFLPSLIGFMNGVGRYSSWGLWSDVRARSLSVPQLTGIVAYFAANGSTLLLLLLLLAGAILAYRRGHTAFMIVFVALGTLLVTLAMQAVFALIEFTKVRYVLVMWGLVAIWTAMGMVYIGRLILNRSGTAPRQSNDRTAFMFAALIPVLWLVGGVHASLDPFYMTEKGLDGDIPRWRGVVNILKFEGQPGTDIFAWYAGQRVHDDEMSFHYSMYEVPFHAFITFSAFDVPTVDWVAGKINESKRVWYGMDTRFPPTDEHTRFVDLLTDDGFSACPAPHIDEPAARLQLYVRSEAFCPGGIPLLRFGDDITLTGWQPLPATASGALHLAMGWQIGADVPAQEFSIALHLLNADGLVKPGDVALPTRRFGIAESTIDLTDVPPGEYSLAVALYRWQTGERLNGTDLQTGATGDAFVMGKIQVTAP